MHGADAPKVWSGVTRWMLVVLFLAAPPDVPGRVVAGRVRRQENRG